MKNEWIEKTAEVKKALEESGEWEILEEIDKLIPSPKKADMGKGIKVEGHVIRAKKLSGPYFVADFIIYDNPAKLTRKAVANVAPEDR